MNIRTNIFVNGQRAYAVRNQLRFSRFYHVIEFNQKKKGNYASLAYFIKYVFITLLFYYVLF